VRLQSVTIDARDPSALAHWWAEVLGWSLTADDDGDFALEPPTDDPLASFPELVFIRVEHPEEGRDRIHLDLATESIEHQERWVAELVAKGATSADVGQPDDAPFTVLADPEGNPFCVLDPRPEYGEPGGIASIVLAAHDARAIRDVWREATGWNLERDDPDWVILRRPDGGGPMLDLLTRPTMARCEAKDRIHLDVAPAADESQDDAVARLLAAGATHAEVGQGADVTWVVLADPEGNELCILSPRD